MPKTKNLELEGEVISSNRGIFKVQIDNVDLISTCHLSGKLEVRKIRVMEGDRVKLETSPYDFSKGRITYRLNK